MTDAQRLELERKNRARVAYLLDGARVDNLWLEEGDSKDASFIPIALSSIAASLEAMALLAADGAFGPTVYGGIEP